MEVRTLQNFLIKFFQFNIFILLIPNFFITGRNDETTCFHCGIGLRDWVAGDIVYQELAKWSPFCVYVRFVKGPTFVNESLRLSQRDGTGDIYTVALQE
jgi:hypothetical protein